ncbi:MAG: protein kinase, partial [Vicinamibacterales bacterium]
MLDFGLAKAPGPTGAGATADLSNSPTLTSPAMTQAGMILGTAAYMAPEQAKGRPVDRRADIWAFGAVLFEMLTGQRAFPGEDVTDTLANVLKTDPAWERLPADVPARIRQVLRSCLQRDAKQRLGDMQSVRLALDGAFETVAPQTAVGALASARGTRRAWVFAGVAALGMAMVAVPALRYLREAPPPAAHVTHTAITLTPDLPLSPTPVALSPDGQTLAMTAGNQIVLRRLDNTKLTPLPGTEGGSTPFFSPDGNWIGFVAAGELRRIRVDGTSRQTIGKLSSALQGPPDWAVDDLIYFGATGTGLFRVPASGGAPTPSTQPHREAGEITHRSPQVLDDGHTVLFTIDRSDGAVPALLSVPSGEWRVIPGIRSDFARYVPSGHLLYRQGESVFAVPMSLASGTTTGTPEPLFGGVFADLYSSLAMSADGALAYLPDSIATSNQARIALVSRSGTVTSVVDDNVTPLVSVSAGLRFSPDAGSIVAVLLAGGSDIWTYDLRRGARIKLTDRGPINSTPTWSPDGTQVAFNSTREPAGIYVQSLDAAGAAKLVLRRGAAVQAPGAWSRDGRTLVFVENNPRTGSDLWTLTLDGKAMPLLVTPARERGPRLSPDGRWLTYQSDTAGRDDVSVASF